MVSLRPEIPVQTGLTYEQLLIYSYVMSAAPPIDTQSDPSTEIACDVYHSTDAESLADIHARLLAPSAVDAIANVFNLLGDPTRVRLVDALTHGERCVCDLATLVGQTESAVSHQLRLLRAARLVRVRRSGRLSFYSLDDHHVVGLLHDTRKHVEEQA